MRPVLFLAFFLATLLPLRAQVGVNLVPNPSFEEGELCPAGGMTPWTGDLSLMPHHPTYWYSATLTSPDWFHTCSDSLTTGVPHNVFGFEYPKTGNAYVGIGSDFMLQSNKYIQTYSEYIHTKLTRPLIPGLTYKISLSITLAENEQVGNDAIMIALTNFPLVSSDYLPIYYHFPIFMTDSIIKKKNGWEDLSVLWQATAKIEYMTIGIFNNDVRDFTFEKDPGEIFSSYYYIDNVNVIQIDSIPYQEHKDRIEIASAFSPNNDGLNDVFYPINISFYEMEIYDRYGRIIHKGIKWEPNTSIPEGVYCWKIYLPDNSIYVGSVTLIR